MWCCCWYCSAGSRYRIVFCMFFFFMELIYSQFNSELSDRFNFESGAIHEPASSLWQSVLFLLLWKTMRWMERREKERIGVNNLGMCDWIHFRFTHILRLFVQTVNYLFLFVRAIDFLFIFLFFRTTNQWCHSCNFVLYYMQNGWDI